MLKVEEEKECKKASVTIYVVNSGDTLWDLAKKYNTTMDSLIKINELEGPEALIEGKEDNNTWQSVNFNNDLKL